MSRVMRFPFKLISDAASKGRIASKIVTIPFELELEIAVICGSHKPLCHFTETRTPFVLCCLMFWKSQSVDSWTEWRKSSYSR